MSVELEGRMNEMCNVSDYWEEVALQTGRKEGREEGRKKEQVSLIVKKIKKNKTVAEIADDLEEKEEVIAPIYEAALSMKPDYDVEKIYELLEKKKIGIAFIDYVTLLYSSRPDTTMSGLLQRVNCYQAIARNYCQIIKALQRCITNGII